MLMHTRQRPVASTHGLITTVAARLGGAPATYALEGSVAVAGSLIGWLRDNLGIIGDASEVEKLARSVPDSGDVVFVPAFSGLFAPHWRSDARGVIADGSTRSSLGAFDGGGLSNSRHRALAQGRGADPGLGRSRCLGRERCKPAVTGHDLADSARDVPIGEDSAWLRASTALVRQHGDLVGPPGLREGARPGGGCSRMQPSVA
jgi:FGGY family of carbohydrate kinases, C-terminal domain